ncbi:MAG: hypothetical protein E5299_01121 [Burkholderia gladioli]|nr:MAG: hypothetical protein E5299_01121 [Burkholderia gladioli]
MKPSLPECPTPYPHVVSPCLYGDTLIQALLGVKTVYRLTVRALQGCTQSLRDLAFPSLPVPNYTTLCRRAKTLDVELLILRDNEPIHLFVDSTGLKVYGEGEWKVRQHGYSKPRTWRKVHLALNANKGQVHAALMTQFVILKLAIRPPCDGHGNTRHEGESSNFKITNCGSITGRLVQRPLRINVNGSR